jgi:small subunit ribosomal protein S7
MQQFPRIYEPENHPQPVNRDLCDKFVRCLMRNGKRNTAERLFARALAGIQKRLPYADAMDVCEQAVEYTKPIVELRSQRVDGTTYEVPVWVDRGRQESLAIRWLIRSARGRHGRPTDSSLADVILAAHQGW